MTKATYTVSTITEVQVEVPDSVFWDHNPDNRHHRRRLIFLTLLGANHHNFEELESDFFSQEEARVKHAAWTLNTIWDQALAVENALWEMEH